jgi:hypothetical protein
LARCAATIVRRQAALLFGGLLSGARRLLGALARCLPGLLSGELLGAPAGRLLFRQLLLSQFLRAPARLLLGHLLLGHLLRGHLLRGHLLRGHSLLGHLLLGHSLLGHSLLGQLLRTAPRLLFRQLLFRQLLARQLVRLLPGGQLFSLAPGLLLGLPACRQLKRVAFAAQFLLPLLLKQPGLACLFLALPGQPIGPFLLRAPLLGQGQGLLFHDLLLRLQPGARLLGRALLGKHRGLLLRRQALPFQRLRLFGRPLLRHKLGSALPFSLPGRGLGLGRHPLLHC